MHKARLDILRIHSRKMNLTRGINLRKIAETMPGASGAEIKVHDYEIYDSVLDDDRYTNLPLRYSTPPSTPPYTPPTAPPSTPPLLFPLPLPLLLPLPLPLLLPLPPPSTPPSTPPLYSFLYYSTDVLHLQ